MNSDRIIVLIIWSIAAVLLIYMLLVNPAKAQGLDGAMMGTFAWEMDRRIWTHQKPERIYQTRQTQPTQETPPVKKKTWYQKSKEWVSKKFIPATPPITTIPTIITTCEGTTWTIPSGTKKVRVRILTDQGVVRNTYTISDYISLRPGQQLVVEPSC